MTARHTRQHFGLLRSLLVSAVIATACSGTTTDGQDPGDGPTTAGTAGGAGTVGASGVSGSAGTVDASGVSGSGGTVGSSTTPPLTCDTAVEFDVRLADGVDPAAFCSDCGLVTLGLVMAGAAPGDEVVRPLGYTNINGAPLLEPECGKPDCGGILCAAGPACPIFPCAPREFEGGALRLIWQGTIVGGQGMCGAPGTLGDYICNWRSCVDTPGTYTARVCLRHALAPADPGVTCTAAETESCTDVEFTLPATEPVPVEIGLDRI